MERVPSAETGTKVIEGKMVEGEYVDGEAEGPGLSYGDRGEPSERWVGRSSKEEVGGHERPWWPVGKSYRKSTESSAGLAGELG